MPDWILIEEGAYPVEKAFLLTRRYSAAPFEDVWLEVYLNDKDERRVRGRGMAVNMQIVELLETEDEIDLLLDLGGEFKYFVKSPSIAAGKVFSPGVKSLIHFIAQEPLQKLDRAEYMKIRSLASPIGSAEING